MFHHSDLKISLIESHLIFIFEKKILKCNKFLNYAPIDILFMIPKRSNFLNLVKELTCFVENIFLLITREITQNVLSGFSFII